jgi:hypothetical protein
VPSARTNLDFAPGPAPRGICLAVDQEEVVDGEQDAPAGPNYRASGTFSHCSVLVYGFAGLQYAKCKHDPLVPLSCKTRVWRPSPA